MSGKRNNPRTGKGARKKEAARKAAAKAKQENKKLNTPAVTDEAKEQVVKEPDTVKSYAATEKTSFSKTETKTKRAKKKRVKKSVYDDHTYTADCIDDSDIPLITEQIHDLRSEYISIQSNFLTVTSIAFVGFGVVLYYAFLLDNNKDNPADFINFVFIALPFLFGISFLNILKYTVRMMGIGSYVSHLEKLLNAKSKKNIFLWHKKLVGINGYTIVGLAQIPCYVALFILVGMKFYENMVKFYANEPVLSWLIWIFTIFLIGIGIYSILVASTQHKSVGYWSRFLFISPYDVEVNTHVFYKDHQKRILKAQKEQTNP